MSAKYTQNITKNNAHTSEINEFGDLDNHHVAGQISYAAHSFAGTTTNQRC